MVAEEGGEGVVNMELARTICFWVVVGTGCTVFLGIAGYWIDRGVLRLIRLIGSLPALVEFKRWRRERIRKRAKEERSA